MDNKSLLVIFPGVGYHADKPLLYYARKLAKEAGYDECINLSYGYDAGNIRGNEKKMVETFTILYKQACEALKDTDFSKYERVLFVSKSIGTIIATNYAHEFNINVKQVLYTPLKYTFNFPIDNGLAFIGNADPWTSDIDGLIELANKADIKIHLYDGCNHSLETEDAIKNLEIINDVMIKTKEFLNR